MAAAEYYQHQIPAANGPQPNQSPVVRPPYLSPPSTYVPLQRPPSSGYPSQQPPPYQYVEMPAEKPYRPEDQQHQRNSFSHPDPRQAAEWTSSYGQLPPPPQHQIHKPMYPQGPQHLPDQYLKHQPVYHNPHSHLRPDHGNSPYQGNISSTNLAYGYSSDPEPDRRRRSRKKSSSRSTTADGFLGAAGGGLLGDLILPGLGTVGGAIAGYFGGKDYGKHRKRRESRNS